jgi:hypothetical protein
MHSAIQSSRRKQRLGISPIDKLNSGAAQMCVWYRDAGFMYRREGHVPRLAAGFRRTETEIIAIA